MRRFWDDDEDGQITAVCVLDFRDTHLQESVADGYGNSIGDDFFLWLSDAHPTANPAGLFADFAFRCGFKSMAVMKECLREFAQLESCEWARKMLVAVQRTP